MNPVLAALRTVALAAAVLTGALPAFAVDLQGHRGARALLPENTLPAFERAIALGVSTLELDVAITQDGVMVIHHDLAPNPATTRDAAGRWLDAPGAPIAARSWAELQTLDVGRLKPDTGYARTHATQEPLDGTRIPRLAELFALVQRLGRNDMRFAIETKLDPRVPDATRAPEPFVRQLLDEIRAAGVQNRVQILSFDWRTLALVQKLAPEVPTVYLSAQQKWLDNIGAGADKPSLWTNGIAWRDHGSVPKMIQAAGGRIWSVFHGDLTPALLAEAHGLGLQVLAWTVNDTPTMERLLQWGVDGLVTDRPDLGKRAIEAAGKTIAPLPAAR